MAPRKRKTEEKPRSRPKLTPQAREAELISLAMDLAESQLRDGTASSQTINHFLKMGSGDGQIERRILERQEKLITAKTENLESQRKSNELYAEVLSRMKIYAGGDDYEEEDL